MTCETQGGAAEERSNYTNSVFTREDHLSRLRILRDELEIKVHKTT